MYWLAAKTDLLTFNRLKWDFDRAEIVRRIESACMFRLEHRKRKAVEVSISGQS